MPGFCGPRHPIVLMKKAPNLLIISGLLSLLMALAIGAAYSAAITTAGSIAGSTVYLVDDSTGNVSAPEFTADLAEFVREKDITVVLEAGAPDTPPRRIRIFSSHHVSHPAASVNGSPIHRGCFSRTTP